MSERKRFNVGSVYVLGMGAPVLCVGKAEGLVSYPEGAWIGESAMGGLVMMRVGCGWELSSAEDFCDRWNRCHSSPIQPEDLSG